ncbi:MAG: radical SAM protein [Rhodospirillaceae bacterium]|nr:radical SAM protein [Rhodospirillaceae bacterium]
MDDDADHDIGGTTPSITSRIDAITLIPEDYRTITPPCPRSAKIEFTARCNYGCAFCARSLQLRDHKDMAWTLFERLLPELRAAGVEEIGMFYLGESFLSPWLEDAMSYAKHECGFSYVFLTTNGSLATPDRVDSCVRVGLDSLKFSYNFADIEQFRAIAGVKDSLFADMRANILAARTVRDRVFAETGHRCGLFASYIDYDRDQGERMRDAIADIAGIVDEVYALPLYSQADLVTAGERARGWNVTPGNRGWVRCASRFRAGRCSPKRISPMRGRRA